jgi:hypothetical protein
LNSFRREEATKKIRLKPHRTLSSVASNLSTGLNSRSKLNKIRRVTMNLMKKLKHWRRTIGNSKIGCNSSRETK